MGHTHSKGFVCVRNIVFSYTILSISCVFLIICKINKKSEVVYPYGTTYKQIKYTHIIHLCELDFSDKYHNNVVLICNLIWFFLKNISCITSKGAAHQDDNHILRNLVKGNKHFRSNVEIHLTEYM